MAGLLLRSGANVQAANRYGVAPLVLACANGSDRMVDLLLKAKADPNTAAGDGETVLMTASRTGNAAAVKLLIAARRQGQCSGRLARPDSSDVGRGGRAQPRRFRR